MHVRVVMHCMGSIAGEDKVGSSRCPWGVGSSLLFRKRGNRSKGKKGVRGVNMEENRGEKKGT